MMTQSVETKREQAKKRVEEIKGLLGHVKIFMVVNGLLFVLKKGWLLPLLPEWFPEESYYFDWVTANIIVWALILMVHTLYVFRHKFTFLRKWEERQIQKYMDEDDDTFN